ncbi:MAG TPA: hypothetical protein PKO45_12780 [Rubrivivax sp.]|nr:hypothetical protein [Rubrivivax sp.]
MQQLAKLRSYRRRLGWRATLSRLALEARRRLASLRQAGQPSASTPRPDWAQAWTPSGHRSAPLFYRTPRGNRRRVTLLCRGIDRHGPCDGTRAALALAVMTANRLHADLRLIAARQAVDPSALNGLLRSQGLAVHGECTLGGPVAPRSTPEFDRFDGELILAASCRFASEALAELPAEDLVCLLHPDDPDLSGVAPGEGDAGALLARTDLRFVVSPAMFKQYLVGRGFPHLAQHALSFELALPAAVAVQPLADAGRSAFLFEVVAPVDRERFAIGLAAIEQALALDILDPQRWDFLFAAPGLPQVALRHGARPTALDHLEAGAAWQVRQRAVLALWLPSPGAAVQAPLGVAAGNAVVVVATADPPAAATPDVITCALERDGIVEALGCAAERLGDDARQARTVPAGHGSPSLEATVEQLSAGR